MRRALLAWYRTHHRVLPWRPPPGAPAGSLPPYYTLVSEAMLQQTQVATVVAYFERFIAALPTLEDLAAADPQHVLRLWQGLGYYRRARNLHAAARMCCERFDGRVPKTVEQLLELPGVGRYSAGAIASIAHGQCAPILDGNVARVLARVLAIREPIDQTPTRHHLWAVAAALVPRSPRSSPGDFNQAMMELGARVCTPRDPDCAHCPLRGRCAAYAAGCVAELPVVRPRKQPKPVTHRVLVVQRGRAYLLVQRPGKGLWSSMWECPTAEALEGQTLIQWAQSRLGLALYPPTALGHFTHQTTHRAIRFEVSVAKVRGGRVRRGTGVWRALHKLDDLPLSNPQRRVMELLRGVA